MADPSARWRDAPPTFNVERLNRLEAPQWGSQGSFRTLSGARASGLQFVPVDLVRDKLWPRTATWFQEALAQVDRIDQEAQEEGWPPITNVAKRNAKHVLATTRTSFIEPEVYPSMDGEIALYFKSPFAAAGLLVLIDSQGGAGCFWSANGKSEREHYKDAWDLPTDVLWGRLRTLGGSPLSQSLD